MAREKEPRTQGGSEGFKMVDFISFSDRIIRKLRSVNYFFEEGESWQV